MKKLLITLIATAAVAVPATALAWNGHDDHGGAFGFFANRGGFDDDHHGGGTFAELSGTGTSFGGTTATANGSIVAGNDHTNGHFSVSLSTTWSSATSKSFADNDGDADDGTFTFSCAPATGTVTLSNGSTSTTTLAGKTCSWSVNGATRYAFFGTDAADNVHGFLKEDTSNNVKGAVVSGRGAPVIHVGDGGHVVNVVVPSVHTSVHVVLHTSSHRH
jgi:hypothetical protein